MLNSNSQEIEQRLVTAYDRGLLVPFIGAGMSVPVCPLWGDFVAGLERQAGIQDPTVPSDFVRRAARATRRIRHAPDRELADVVRSTLCSSPQPPPDQLDVLASVYWPLVLTTNYDDLFMAAGHERFERAMRGRPGRERVVPHRLLGRSADDCHRVLMSLRRPELPIVWALQGFVGGQASFARRSTPDYATYAMEDEEYRLQVERLRNELVVGHAEYRHVALSSRAFRRAFGEVYRSRSLLFLGSGLTDQYFLDLISEVVELYGPSPLPHYAYIARDEVDADFLRDYFGIWVVELDGYEELPDRLRALADHIEGPRRRQSGWRLGPTSSRSAPTGRASIGNLSLERGRLVDRPSHGACVVISAGGNPNALSVSHVGIDMLDELGLGHTKQDFERVDDPADPESIPIWRHVDAGWVLAVNARMNPWTKQGARLRPLDPTVKPFTKRSHPTATGATMRDFRLVTTATKQMIECAHDLGFRSVHSMLLAAGGRRTFPRSFSLLQMVRGWARSGQDGPVRPELTIYVPSENREVWLDLQSGRLDLVTGLDSDTVEFWVVLEDAGGRRTRFLASEPSDRSVLDLAVTFDAGRDGWLLDLDPRPTQGWANWTIRGVKRWEQKYERRLDLERLGVLPGSVLTLSSPRPSR